MVVFKVVVYSIVFSMCFEAYGCNVNKLRDTDISNQARHLHMWPEVLAI